MADRKTGLAKKKNTTPSSNGHQGEPENEMSFLDHLEELRWHIIRSMIAILTVSIVLYIFNDWFFDVVLLGPTHDHFISYGLICQLSEYLGLGQTMCFEPPDFQTIATGFAEPFITAIKVSFIGGFVLAFPYVFSEIWAFVVPGLYDNERKVTRGIIIICSILFLMGVLFGYFVIAPFAINFLGGYQIPNVSNSPTIRSFITYMVMFTMPAGLIFQLPVVVYFLAKLGIVTPDVMRKYRRHSVIGILMLAALLTPPDVVTQFLIGVPLYFLYEASILVAIWVYRNDDFYDDDPNQPKKKKKKWFGKRRSKKGDKSSGDTGAVTSVVQHKPETVSSARVDDFEARRLNDHRFVALAITRAEVALRSTVLVTGISIEGRQILLGAVPEGASNEYNSLRGILAKLSGRGMDYHDGLLCLIDREPMWRRIVKEVFDDNILIQVNTGQFIEDVVANMEIQGTDTTQIRARFAAAYSEPDYAAAKEKLDQLYVDLQVTDSTSAEILRDGIEDSITLKLLDPRGIFPEDFASAGLIEQLQNRMPRAFKTGTQAFRREKYYEQLIVATWDFESLNPTVEQAEELPGLADRVNSELRGGW